MTRVVHAQNAIQQYLVSDFWYNIGENGDPYFLYYIRKESMYAPHFTVSAYRLNKFVISIGIILCLIIIFVVLNVWK